MPPAKIGPYEIIKVLGRGGMGTVFRAVHEDDGQIVALKLLSASYADDDHFRTRFAAEVETLLQLRHPNIVRLISYGQEEGQLFFAMELVEGQSFHEVLKSGYRFKWQEVVEFTRQICSGLRHAHDRGIIHRDLKPGNLLLTSDGIAKITDFGIAKQFGGRKITAVGGVVGTADFMAPEQLHGKPATIRSDMYSLGVVMYTLLARRPPFSFNNVSEAISTLDNQPPTRLTVFAPECPNALAAIVHKLLERQPQKRIGTAQALANRLDHLAEELAQSVDSDQDDDDHESFDILQGPVEAHRNFQVSGEVFNQPTAPAELSTDQTDRGSTPDDGELTLQPIEGSTPSGAPATVSNTNFTISPKSRADYFATVTEEESEPQTDDDHLPVWFYVVSLTLLIGVISAGIWAVFLWRPSADQLYAKIERLIQESDDPSSAEQAIKEFQKRFPDDERAQAVAWHELRIEADRLPRRLQVKARLRGIHDLLPIEQDFLHAMDLAKTDPIAAKNEFQAIENLYRNLRMTKSHQQCLIAAGTQIEVLDRVIEEDQQIRTDQIESALKMAQDSLNVDPVRSQEICQSVITLYRNREWAAELVKDAGQLLKLAQQEIEEHANTPPEDQSESSDGSSKPQESDDRRSENGGSSAGEESQRNAFDYGRLPKMGESLA